MRKFKYIFVVLLFLMLFSSCNKKNIQNRWRVEKCYSVSDDNSVLGSNLILLLNKYIENSTIEITNTDFIINDSISYNYTLNEDTLLLNTEEKNDYYAISWKNDTLLLSNDDVVLLLVRE